MSDISRANLSAFLSLVPKQYRWVVALLVVLVGIGLGVVAESTPLVETSIVVPDGYVAVSKVIDGDTIDVVVSGKVERVRVLGLNTPETVDPRRPVQCFGKEASENMKKLVTGVAVRLMADPTQDDRDKYDRMLRYVELVDGTDVGEKMIADGFAYEYTYGSPAYQRQAGYRAAQAEAKGAERGLWDPGTCDGRK